MNCPYPETLKDECTNQLLENPLNKAWHEGYSAHKLEMVELSKKLASLATEYTRGIAQNARDAGELVVVRNDILKLKAELLAKRL